MFLESDKQCMSVFGCVCLCIEWPRKATSCLCVRGQDDSSNSVSPATVDSCGRQNKNLSASLQISRVDCKSP